jgi:two-component system NarL family response regulator
MASSATTEHGGSEAERARFGAPARRADGARLKTVLIETNSIAGLGLARLLADHGIEVAGETGCVEAGLMLAQRSAADVVLVDVQPESRALAVVSEITRSFPPARVVILLSAEQGGAVLAALGAGVSGCVAREAAAHDVVRAIHAAARSDVFVSPIAAARVRRRLYPAGTSNGHSAPLLSDREREVLRLLARGCGNGEIAKALFLSPATVKHHIASIFVKLQVRNRIQAAVRAVEEGLLDDV